MGRKSKELLPKHKDPDFKSFYFDVNQSGVP